MTYHHFEILRREDGELWVLGQGAGGITYKARDTQLARWVALKVVTADAFKTPEAKERFVAEARTAASLHHPNIASIYYFGEQDGDCFCAMEFVDGCTLEELVQREGALSAAAALDIASQTAAALGVAHDADLIHRDVKPANILITESSSGARSVKLIDFGLAAGANAAAGGKAVFAGTPLFASPEQLDEADVDSRSDIYSLGAVLFFMISGRPPYTGTLSQIVTQHTLQPTPVDLISSAPAEVIALVKRYMKKDPNQRPRSGAQARAEAEAALRTLRPGNQATATEWLTTHYEAVSRQRQVDGGFLYRLTKSGEQAEALHLDRSAAGLQAADQYRFAVPKIAGLGSTCLREPGTLVEVADGLLIITKDPAPSTRLLSVMRVRRMLPLDEARLILEPLARALDEAAAAGLAIPHLGLRDIELCPALEPQTPLKQWPDLNPRVDLLPIAEPTSITASATIVGSSLVTSSRAAPGEGASASFVVASLAYELLGGMTAPTGSHYVPLAELSETQNLVLREALGHAVTDQSAKQVAAQLFEGSKPTYTRLGSSSRSREALRRPINDSVKPNALLVSPKRGRRKTPIVAALIGLVAAAIAGAVFFGAAYNEPKTSSDNAHTSTENVATSVHDPSPAAVTQPPQDASIAPATIEIASTEDAETSVPDAQGATSSQPLQDQTVSPPVASAFSGPGVIPYVPKQKNVLLIGDSFSVGSFGDNLESSLLKRYGRENVAIFASCGSSPESWLWGEHVTECGYRQTMPTNNLLLGYNGASMPRPVRTPKLRAIFTKKRGFQTAIVQLGTGWISEISHTNQVDERRYRKIIGDFIRELRLGNPKIVIFWVLPPASSVYPKRLHDEVERWINEESVNLGFFTVNSRAITGPYLVGKTGPDGVAYSDAAARAWARGTFAKFYAGVRRLSELSEQRRDAGNTQIAEKKLDTVSTRIALVASSDPSAAVVTTMPGTYDNIGSLVMALLKSPENGAGGSGRHFFKEPMNLSNKDLSAIQPLHHYFKGARIVDGGSGVVLSFSKPALEYIDQPTSGGAAAATGPIITTVKMNYPNIENFYWEFDGRIWTEGDWNF